MTLWGNMVFRFYDFHVQEYEWDKTNSTLFIICKYQDREKVKVEFENPKDVQFFEILPKRIIEFIKHVNDENSDTPCFEIKCKDIFETAFVWADNVRIVQN